MMLDRDEVFVAVNKLLQLSNSQSSIEQKCIKEFLVTCPTKTVIAFKYPLPNFIAVVQKETKAVFEYKAGSKKSRLPKVADECELVAICYNSDILGETTKECVMADFKIFGSMCLPEKRLLVCLDFVPHFPIDGWRVVEFDLQHIVSSEIERTLVTEMFPFQKAAVLARASVAKSGGLMMAAQKGAIWALTRELAQPMTFDDSLQHLDAGRAKVYGGGGGVVEPWLSHMNVLVEATTRRLCQQEMHLRWGISCALAFEVERAETFLTSMSQSCSLGAVVTRLNEYLEGLPRAIDEFQSSGWEVSQKRMIKARLDEVKAAIGSLRQLIPQLREDAERAMSLVEAEAFASLSDWLCARWGNVTSRVPNVDKLVSDVRSYRVSAGKGDRRGPQEEFQLLQTKVHRVKAHEFFFVKGMLVPGSIPSGAGAASRGDRGFGILGEGTRWRFGGC
jgi:hypothetical protein